MSNRLDFTPLETIASGSHPDRPQSARRWKNREADPTVQMSIRMQESVYSRFRKHCEDDRRSNGEMLEIMMEAYEAALKEKVRR